MRRYVQSCLLIVVGLAIGYWLAAPRGGRVIQVVKRAKAAVQAHVPQPAPAKAELWLGDFESEEELTTQWQARDASVERSEEHATHGRFAAKVTLTEAQSPALILSDGLAGARRDWRPYGSLRFDLYNPQGSPQRLILQIKDADDRRFKKELQLEGKAQQVVRIDLGEVGGQVHLARIRQVSLFQWEPKAAHTFFVDAVRLAPPGTESAAAAVSTSQLRDAAVSPNRLAGLHFAKHRAKWQGIDATTGQPVVRVPLTLATPPQPLSVGFPISGGVPFPLGQLAPGAGVRLRDDAGVVWPVQTRVLATWEDGSVKWLDVVTAVPPMATQRALWLEYGPPVSASGPSASRVIVEDGADAVTVTTGPLRFAVGKRRFRLFESAAVDRDGDGAFSEAERLAGAGDLVITHQGRTFRSSADTKSYTLTVEESGPLRATLKADGWFRDERGNGFCRFTVRLQAFAGLPQVRVYHTFIYTGYPANRIHHEYKGIELPDNETIEAIRLEWPVTVIAGATAMSADDQGAFSAPVDTRLTIAQHAHDGLRVLKGATALREARRSEGWLLVQDARAGVLVGIRDAWQQFPKELAVDPATGRLSVDLWPVSAGPLSLETSQAAFGPDDVARGSAFGLAKTHELIVGFLGVPVDQQTARSLASLWNEPWLVVGEPGWLQATNALGEIGPSTWTRFKDVESLLNGLFAWGERQPRRFGWYGMLDYGDTRLWYRKEAYDKSYDDWGWHPEGRWGWHNCEDVGTHTAALIGFLRTHDSRYFRFGEAKARHVMDVDTVHHNTVANDPRLAKTIPDTFAQVGSMHRHSTDHWSGRNEEATHTHVLGLLLYYYMTGYDRARDVANEVGAFLLKDPVTYTKHPDIAPLRGIANVIWGDVLLYQATWDTRYRAAADRWVAIVLDGQRKDGTWLETYNPRDGRWEGAVKGNYITLHVLPALIAYHRLTGNERVAQAILRGTKAMFEREGYLQSFDAAAYSYLLTGEEWYLTQAQERLERVMAAQQRSDDPLRNGMIYDKIIYDRVSASLYTVPLLLGAVGGTHFPEMRHTLGVSEPPPVTGPVRAAPAAARGESEAPYEVLVLHSAEKVLPERGLSSRAHANPAAFSLARNEHEAVQLVLRSDRPLAGVTLETRDLIQPGTDARIPREAVTWSPVGFVKTKKPGYAVAHVGWWPDPLPGPQPVDVASGWPQPFWVSVYAAPQTPPGEYRGILVIRATDAPPTTVEVRVTVWDFELPATPTLTSAFDVYPNRIASAYSTFFPDWWSRWQARPTELLRRFHDDLLRFRLSPILNADLEDEPTRAWLTQARTQLSGFAVGRHGGSFDNDWPKEPQALAQLEEVYRGYADVLRETDLLDAHYIYTYDEPAPGLPHVAQVARMIRRADPALKNLVVLHGAPDVERLAGWLEPVDIICLRNVTFDEAAARRLRQLGKALWLYVSGPVPPYPTLVIDYPAMAYRILPWMCWKYGLSGLLYWSVNYWTTNPYEEPMNTPWAQNGNGSLYYPGPDGPVPSIRLAVLRDGMEDYEYLHRLRELVTRVRQRTAQPDAAGAHALLAQAERLLAIDPSLVASMREYTGDPDVLSARRSAIATAIEQLQDHLTTGR